MASRLRPFFSALFDLSGRLFEGLPMAREPQLMAYVTGVLAPAITARKAAWLEECRELPLPPAAGEAPAAGPPVGLNTVGMLLDRLSILAVKHWKLRNVYGDPDAAATLAATQIAELAAALAAARPGYSSLNNKMTSHRVDATAADFSEAFFGLQTTNLLIWEAQEVLYTRDIQALPAEELRAYLAFFSRGNLIRNFYIEAADRLYWQERGAGWTTPGSSSPR